MRRIAGTFVMLAAFGGCAEPQHMTRSDRPVKNSQNQIATTAGASWSRPDGQYPPDVPPPDGSSVRNNGTSNFVASPFPPSGPPAEFPPMQTTAKLPFQPNFAPGAPGSGTPLPLPPEMTNTGVAPASLNIDPAVKELPWAGDARAMPGAAPTPPRPPEIVTQPPALKPPEIVTQPQPAKPLEIVTQPPALKPPEIVVEPKQPVSVAIDSRSTGSPALRLVNTKRFSLSFAVQDGGNGVSAIDLWETRDGKTWRKCDNAHSLPTAYLVEVKDEGVFGYTMVARPAGDKGNTQPKLGDMPQIWVTVDATKPVVSLTGVELNLTSKTPNLIVRWSAKDKNFGPRPVTLSYAEHVEGPWVPLATNVENSGHHECAIPANMPKRAFLRVEAVDLVGNSGAAQTDKLVRLDFLSPATASLLPPPPQSNQATADLPRPTVVIYNVEPSGNTPE